MVRTNKDFKKLRNSDKILFVSHDANRAGAQLFLLNVMQYLAKQGQEMHLLLLGGGVLEKDFQAICEVSFFPTKAESSNNILKKFIKNADNEYNKQIESLGKNLQSQHFSKVYLNTIATAWVTNFIKQYTQANIITHIHELEFSLLMYSSLENRQKMFQNSAKIIACSNAVGENLIKKHQVPSNKVVTIHSFVENDSVLEKAKNSSKEAIKQKYNLPLNTILVGACGNAEWRKGLDLFVMMAKKVSDISDKSVHFVWIGVKPEGDFYEKVQYEIERLGNESKLHLIPPTPDAVEIVNALDIFTLTSREDPFPLVMLEAALCQKPIVGFDKTGGCSEFVEADAGFVVPYIDIETMATKISELIDNESLRISLGKKAQEKVLNIYNFENSIKKILNELAMDN